MHRCTELLSVFFSTLLRCTNQSHQAFVTKNSMEKETLAVLCHEDFCILATSSTSSGLNGESGGIFGYFSLVDDATSASQTHVSKDAQLQQSKTEKHGVNREHETLWESASEHKHEPPTKHMFFR